jgi:hypothetical protein
MIDLIDGLRMLLEPLDPDDPEVSVNGAHVDDSCSAPFEWLANTLYAYAESDRRTTDETSAGGLSMERQNFAVVAVYVADGEGENPTGQRRRAVSEALDARRAAYASAIRNNRTNGDLWQWVIAEFDDDYLRQLAVRGIMVRISGYRFVA